MINDAIFQKYSEWLSKATDDPDLISELKQTSGGEGEAAVKVTRLATGIPVGGDLEYIDEITLTRALDGRIEI